MNQIALSEELVSQRAQELVERIWPLVLVESELYFAQPLGLHDSLILALPAERAEGLEHLGIFVTYHPYDYTRSPGETFQPTVSEVLSQFLDYYLEKQAVAFRIEYNLLGSSDFEELGEENGHYSALVHVYGKK